VIYSAGTAGLPMNLIPSTPDQNKKTKRLVFRNKILQPCAQTRVYIMIPKTIPKLSEIAHRKSSANSASGPQGYFPQQSLLYLLFS